MKTCIKKNQVRIGRGRYLCFWSDGSITIGETYSDIVVTPLNIQNAYLELINRGLITPLEVRP